MPAGIETLIDTSPVGVVVFNLSTETAVSLNKEARRIVDRFFRIIEEQADHMHGLVTDLLDLARIETGTLTVNPEPVEVGVLIDRARNTFVSGGGRNNLAIETEPDLPLVMADRRLIVQVLCNLLSNASKHSPATSTIRLTAVREGFQVAVSVADAGRGLTSDWLPHPFRKFSRD